MTETPWEPVATAVLAEIEARVMPLLRKASEDIYTDILYAVQDNLADNATFNIASTIRSAEARASECERRAYKAETINTSLLSALKTARSICADAFKDTGMEWDDESMNAIDDAIAMAEAK